MEHYSFLMEIAGIFCFIGILVSGFLKGELACYCFMISAFFWAIFEALAGEKLMAGTEILACILAAIFAWKIRKYRKLQRD